MNQPPSSIRHTDRTKASKRNMYKIKNKYIITNDKKEAQGKKMLQSWRSNPWPNELSFIWNNQPGGEVPTRHQCPILEIPPQKEGTPVTKGTCICVELTTFCWCSALYTPPKWNTRHKTMMAAIALADVGPSRSQTTNKKNLEPPQQCLRQYDKNLHTIRRGDVVCITWYISKCNNFCCQ